MPLGQDAIESTLDPLVLVAIAVLTALAGVAWLVVRLAARVGRVEERLAALDELATLPDAVRTAVDELERRDLHEALRERLGEVAESHARLAGVVDDLAGRIERQGKLLRDLGATLREARAPSADAPALEDVSATVARHLSGRGYEAVRLLTEGSRLDGRSGTVAFEARRDGVMHKGHVVVADGVVRKESVRSAYSAFP